MINRRTLLFINHHIHYVYTGWMYLFDKYFDLQIHSKARNIDEFGTFTVLKSYKRFRTSSNFFNLYRAKDIPHKENDIIIVGDVFCTNLALSLKGKNVVYYSEYFAYKKSLLKKIISMIYLYLFFRNKKCILPTPKACNTFKHITERILYFPSIYYGEVIDNQKRTYDVINLLYVGRINNGMKRIGFLIETFLKLYAKDKRLRLTLVGKVDQNDFLDIYGKYIDNDIIKHIGYVENDKLRDIYTHNDIFILPSFHDPIAQVILEAMAFGNAIIVSDTVGASDYIQNGENGLVFTSNDTQDFMNQVTALTSNIDLIVSCKKKSCKIIKDSYRHKNDELIEKKRISFLEFMNA